ncbi:hypothetical protein BO70DRAFT_195668 [Aspergillus heteromorphus CBS 117.55]|uniref:Uncharacterized protein n=1 Tax=Aspergillus heteromorphus CBS 117.55 TaxID=1448321 RepID=A0A317WTD0_9EURO|nr:uncharacterized protein BO70DRAFT_195668 [Aspergillus heteromorphus CBS 117.55]PWY87500.1 hypothetical protein BO70DRAFT_195668 [Aspergillus heteromorphus CBS 117.55]
MLTSVRCPGPYRPPGPPSATRLDFSVVGLVASLLCALTQTSRSSGPLLCDTASQGLTTYRSRYCLVLAHPDGGSNHRQSSIRIRSPSTANRRLPLLGTQPIGVGRPPSSLG